MVPVKMVDPEVSKQLTRLRFCRQELVRRADVQPHEAWRWRIKAKVANYLIKRAESELPTDVSDTVRPLVDHDRIEILKRHPLLQLEMPIRQCLGETETSQWARKIREKVTSYLTELKRKRDL